MDVGDIVVFTRPWLPKTGAAHYLDEMAPLVGRAGLVTRKGSYTAQSGDYFHVKMFHPVEELFFDDQYINVGFSYPKAVLRLATKEEAKEVRLQIALWKVTFGFKAAAATRGPVV